MIVHEDDIVHFMLTLRTVDLSPGVTDIGTNMTKFVVKSHIDSIHGAFHRSSTQSINRKLIYSKTSINTCT